jgi:hypothetical protein
VKKDVSHWRPVGLHERPGLATDDAKRIAQLLPGPLAPEALDVFCQRLAWIAAEYRLEEAWRDAPPPSEVRKKLESIRNAAQRLTAQLGVGPRPDDDVDVLDVLPYSIRNALVSVANLFGEAVGGYPDHPPMGWKMPGQQEQYRDFHGDSKLGSAIEHVQLIVAWCDMAIRSARQSEEGAEIQRTKLHGSAGRQARNHGNQPLNGMIAALASLYRDTTGKNPGISRPSRASSAPGGPFVRVVLEVCRRLEVPLTAAALEKRWRTIRPLIRRVAPTIEGSSTRKAIEPKR